MTDSTDTPNPTDTPAGTPVETPAPAGTESGKVEDLPQWARDAISRANGEAAEYRTKLRAAEEAAKSMRPAADFEALETNLSSASTELTDTRRQLAMKVHGLPDAIAASVTGNTLEEMLASAEQLAPLFVNQAAAQRTPQVPASLSGGLNPAGSTGGDESYDPAVLAKQAMDAAILARR